MNRMIRIGGAMALLWAATGCVNEAPDYAEPVDPETAETGYLSLADVGLYVVVDSETDQNTEQSPTAMLTRADGETTGGTTDKDIDPTTEVIKGAEATKLEDYKVTIRSKKTKVDENGNENPVFCDTFDYGELTALEGGLEVPVGEYTISATSNQKAGTPAGVQALPSYAGKVEDVKVDKAKVTEAETITCTLQNIKITVGVAADLYEQLDVLDPAVDSNRKIDATVYYGDKEESSKIKWPVPANWNWTAGTKTETPTAVYFPVLENETTLHFRFRAKIKGEEIEIDRDISDLIKGQWRRIHVVPKYDTTGNLVFDVTVSAFAQDETITVGKSACWTELALPDEPSTVAPSIKWADGTDLPETISAEGAAPQQVTIAAPNLIELVGLTVRMTNPEFAADASAMTKADLCAVASSRQLTNYGIPFGAALKGQSSVSFGLDKILGQIREYAGEYTFAFTVTDQKGSTCEQTLRFVSGGGSVAGPIRIEGVGFNIDERRDISKDGTVELADGTTSGEVKVNVQAANGITALWVTINSEGLLQELEGANIPQKFNLCNLDESLATKLGGLGFPCNDKVLNQTNVEFQISSMLVGALSGFPGDHDFVLEVESHGKTATKTIKLHR